MNKLDAQYQQLLKDILEYGVEKQDRTGTGTKSLFGYTIRHNMQDGFPLLTTKKMAWKTMVTELLWFLKGDTNIKYLVNNDCRIWDGDAYKNYAWQTSMDAGGQFTKEEFINEIKINPVFARKWGDLGSIYGKQWRHWNGLKEYDGYYGGIDQIENLINNLKTNPDSRRLMVSAWNVGELDQMVLPPCHYSFQVYTRELTPAERAVYNKNNVSEQTNPFDGAPERAISLMWNQRSVDTFLGLPFNIASYGLLLTIIAKAVNMVPEHLIGNLGDTHLYLDHIEQAKEQIGRKPFELPTVEINEVDVLKGKVELELKNYLHHPTIKAPLSN